MLNVKFTEQTYRSYQICIKSRKIARISFTDIFGAPYLHWCDEKKRETEREIAQELRENICTNFQLNELRHGVLAESQ